MPLTTQQLSTIRTLLDDDSGIEKRIRDIMLARDDLRSILRIHSNMADANATTILNVIKARGQNASEQITELFL